MMMTVSTETMNPVNNPSASCFSNHIEDPGGHAVLFLPKDSVLRLPKPVGMISFQTFRRGECGAIPTW